MMEGWIKLHRQLCEDKIWLSEPFTRGQAWADMLMIANHEEGFIRVRGIRIDIKRGQIGWSEVKLAERWKWSRTKVRNFLEEIETKDGKIVQQKTFTTSLITIVNYDKYQEKEQQKNSRRTAEVQQKDTNKNDKNEKNSSTPPAADFEFSHNGFFDRQLAANADKPEISKYRKMVEMLHERDEEGNYLFATVLSLAKQISFKDYLELKKLETPGVRSLKSVLEDMENKSDTRKRYTSAYLTCRNWLKRDAKTTQQ